METKFGIARAFEVDYAVLQIFIGELVSSFRKYALTHERRINSPIRGFFDCSQKKAGSPHFRVGGFELFGRWLEIGSPSIRLLLMGGS